MRSGRGSTTRTLLVFATALVALLGACDWPMLHGNPQGTAANPVSGIDRTSVARLGILWSAPASLGSTVTPVESKGVVVAGNIARATSDGSVRWSLPGLQTQVAIAGNIAYGITHPSPDPDVPYTLNALALDTGAVLWSRPGGSEAPIRPPIVADGRLYVSGASPHGGGEDLYAYAASDGRFLWAQFFIPGSAFDGPTVGAGLVYAVGVPPPLTPLTTQSLLAFDAASGRVVFAVRANRCGLTVPMVANGRVYASGSTFDARTGALLWNWPVCPAPSSGSAIAGNTVFVVTQPSSTTRDVDVVAFDATTGVTRWTTRIGTNGAGAHAAPVVANDVVLVSNGTTLTGIDVAKGTKVWTPTPIAGIGDPIAGDGMVFAATANTLYAFRPIS